MGNDDRDPDNHEMDTEEAAYFEHDFEVVLEMFELRYKGVTGEKAYEEASRRVAERRREDRRGESN